MDRRRLGSFDPGPTSGVMPDELRVLTDPCFIDLRTGVWRGSVQVSGLSL